MSEIVKVLHVVGMMGRGGTESLVMNLLREQDRTKFQYDIVEQTSNVCAHDEEIISLGSQIYRCPTISLFNIFQYRKWWKQFFIDHPEYRIIHGHSRGTARIYLKEANSANRITIAHCHSNSYGKGIKAVFRFFWQLPLRHIANYNLACSYGAGVSQYGSKSKFMIVKNGIETEKFLYNEATRAKIRGLLKVGDSFVIGNVARFIDAKNHIFMIDVFQEIKRIHNNSVLLLIGSGPLEEKIKKYTQQKGIDDSVIFLGEVPNIYDYYQAMDAFILPSLYEGLPLVSIEAQCTGLPCYMSDAVTRETEITDLIHYYSLKENPAFWAEKIVDNERKSLPRHSRDREVKESGFDIISTANELRVFYLKILNGKSS